MSFDFAFMLDQLGLKDVPLLDWVIIKRHCIRTEREAVGRNFFFKSLREIQIFDP
jgi:hypothetical protein